MDIIKTHESEIMCNTCKTQYDKVIQHIKTLDYKQEAPNYFNQKVNTILLIKDSVDERGRINLNMVKVTTSVVYLE